MIPLSDQERMLLRAKLRAGYQENRGNSLKVDQHFSTVFALRINTPGNCPASLLFLQSSPNYLSPFPQKLWPASKGRGKCLQGSPRQG